MICVVGILGRCGLAMRPRASKLWSSPLGQILDKFTDETHIDTRFLKYARQFIYVPFMPGSLISLVVIFL